MVRANNRHDGFYDVVMTTINPYGAFVHSRSDWETSWDQQALFEELKKAREKGVAVVTMKTCSGGPYDYESNGKPTFPGAINWVIDQPVVDSAAVAMANFQEIEENAAILRS